MPEPPADFVLPALKPRKPHLYGPDNPPPGKGRLKGSVNRVTRDLKAGIIDAAVALGADGAGTGGLQGYLMWLGRGHPKAFAGLLSKMLPLQVSNEGLASATIGTVNVISVPVDHYLSAEDVERLSAPGLAFEHEPQIEQPEPPIEPPIAQHAGDEVPRERRFVPRPPRTPGWA